MRCPYCRMRLIETSPECPSCKLTLDRANALLGPVPRLGHGVVDLTGILSRADVSRIGKAIERLKWTFPQVDLHILIHGFPTEHPFDLHVFWIFNCGGFCGEAIRAGDNRTILLVLDPMEGRSALMVGYGLEPFLDDEALDRLLDGAEPSWKANQWTRGVLGVIRGLDRLLENAVQHAAAGFGVPVLAISPRRGEF